MADWPADGVTDWNTKMKANIDVGHDSDGTHKKSQMLTDMGWSPTSYVGGESVTFPNGYIIKSGYKAGTGNQTVTFGTAFPTNIIGISFVPWETGSGAGSVNMHLKAKSKTAITFWVNSGAIGVYWTARGY